MKKISLYLCLLIFFSCAGYEPIFSTKDLGFYISKIKNIDNNKTTKKIIRNIRSYKLDDTNNKNYSLNIISEINDEVTSRDSKGDPLTYRVIIKAEVKVFKGESNLLLDTMVTTKDFIYNYQTNQFELGQYKKDIIGNLIVKIAEEIILELQLI
ncbi:hypothetical protein N8824_04325 [Candidatus Pelagibacter sp.]|nr:hypothetical protein [Candidatus Pelagibacter sp.]